MCFKVDGMTCANSARDRMGIAIVKRVAMSMKVTICRCILPEGGARGPIVSLDTYCPGMEVGGGDG